MQLDAYLKNGNTKIDNKNLKEWQESWPSLAEHRHQRADKIK